MFCRVIENYCLNARHVPLRQCVHASVCSFSLRHDDAHSFEIAPLESGVNSESLSTRRCVLELSKNTKNTVSPTAKLLNVL